MVTVLGAANEKFWGEGETVLLIREEVVAVERAYNDTNMHNQYSTPAAEPHSWGQSVEFKP